MGFAAPLQDCVAYIMGRGGKVLRNMEEEWGTLMFFAEVKGGKYGGKEKLAIFGSRRARRGAELKVPMGWTLSSRLTTISSQASIFFSFHIAFVLIRFDTGDALADDAS